VVTRFADAILVVIALIAFFLLWQGRAAAPALNGLSPDVQKQVMANYKDLAAILSERLERTFDLLVTKGLLPVFATLIGFLLGKQRAEGS
jgi:hypothetical protein